MNTLVLERIFFFTPPLHWPHAASVCTRWRAAAQDTFRSLAPEDRADFRELWFPSGSMSVRREPYDSAGGPATYLVLTGVQSLLGLAQKGCIRAIRRDFELLCILLEGSDDCYLQFSEPADPSQFHPPLSMFGRTFLYEFLRALAENSSEPRSMDLLDLVFFGCVPPPFSKAVSEVFCRNKQNLFWRACARGRLDIAQFLNKCDHRLYPTTFPHDVFFRFPLQENCDTSDLMRVECVRFICKRQDERLLVLLAQCQDWKKEWIRLVRFANETSSHANECPKDSFVGKMSALLDGLNCAQFL